MTMVMIMVTFVLIGLTIRGDIQENCSHTFKPTEQYVRGIKKVCTKCLLEEEEPLTYIIPEPERNKVKYKRAI